MSLNLKTHDYRETCVFMMMTVLKNLRVLKMCVFQQRQDLLVSGL